jgi:dTDP-4-dehydrorhamnose reductase
MSTVLITGASGTLGRAFQRSCDVRALSCRLTSRHELDIADPASVAAALDAVQPWLVVNAAGYVRVDDAEDEPERCMRENAIGPAVLATETAARAIRFVTFSSDLVFDGEGDAPYCEHHAPSPINVYGTSKLAAERVVLACNPTALVVRTSAFFGPNDRHNFVAQFLHALRGAGTVRAASDAIVSPTYVPDLVEACLDLAIDGEHGIWHLANDGAASWADLARAVATAAGLPPDRVIAVPGAELGWRARRPAFSALGSSRATLLPSFEDALARHVNEISAGGKP